MSAPVSDARIRAMAKHWLRDFEFDLMRRYQRLSDEDRRCLKNECERLAEAETVRPSWIGA